jgi:hypothetical protein
MYPSAFALYLVALNLSAGIGAAMILSVAAAKLSASPWGAGVLAKDIVAALALMLAATLTQVLAGPQLGLLPLDAFDFVVLAATGVGLRQLWVHSQRA